MHFGMQACRMKVDHQIVVELRQKLHTLPSKSLGLLNRSCQIFTRYSWIIAMLSFKAA